MPRMKDVSNKLGVATVAAHQYGKGYKVRNTILKWETFKTAASVPRRGRPTKFVPRSDREMFRETEKTKHVNICNNTIRRLNKYGLFGRVLGRKPLLSKKNKTGLQSWWSTSISAQTPKTKWWRGDNLQPLHLEIIELLPIKSSVYQSILESNLGQNWVMQQDNDSKHRSKSTTEWQKKKIISGPVKVQKLVLARLVLF
uniref:Transposase Tc1-like domain-containing protein n=1 Tax=Neolamprologus brichardi TaxID=32507 RepID=A0A3Q4HI71_NEOBR